MMGQRSQFQKEKNLTQCNQVEREIPSDCFKISFVIRAAILKLPELCSKIQNYQVSYSWTIQNKCLGKDIFSYNKIKSLKFTMDTWSPNIKKHEERPIII